MGFRLHANILNRYWRLTPRTTSMGVSILYPTYIPAVQTPVTGIKMVIKKSSPSATHKQVVKMNFGIQPRIEIWILPWRTNTLLDNSTHMPIYTRWILDLSIAQVFFAELDAIPKNFVLHAGYKHCNASSIRIHIRYPVLNASYHISLNSPHP